MSDEAYPAPHEGGQAGGRGKPGQGYQAAILDGALVTGGYEPLGLDSHRYRCRGNGVVAPVAEWIGRRLRDHIEGMS